LKPRLDSKTPPAWGWKSKEQNRMTVFLFLLLNPTQVGFRDLAVVSTAWQMFIREPIESSRQKG